MPLPTKLYSDIDKLSTENFKFITRDPAKEMEYTVKTLAEIMSQTGSTSWAGAETAAGNVLKERFNAVENTLFGNINSRWASKLTSIKDEVLGTQPEFAYGQYLAGMSAAFGGGHTNTAIFSKVSSEERKLAIIDAATKNLQSLNSLTYQSTSAMPLVVPIESQLVADASASAVESYAMAEIRAQQIRQSVASGTILAAAAPNQGSNPTPYEEVLAFAGIQATGAASLTK